MTFQEETVIDITALAQSVSVLTDVVLKLSGRVALLEARLVESTPEHVERLTGVLDAKIENIQKQKI